MASSSGQKQYSLSLLDTPGVLFDLTIKDPQQRIKAYIDAYARNSNNEHQGFDDVLMSQHMQILSATCSSGQATALFLVKGGSNLTNRLGSLHGGAVALIFDLCTTMCAAPLAKEGFWKFGGVSRNLSVSFLRPAQGDNDILVECEVLQIGARLATIRGQMRDRETGVLLSVAEHTKASVSFAEKI